MPTCGFSDHLQTCSASRLHLHARLVLKMALSQIMRCCGSSRSSFDLTRRSLWLWHVVRIHWIAPAFAHRKCDVAVVSGRFHPVYESFLPVWTAKLGTSQLFHRIYGNGGIWSKRIFAMCRCSQFEVRKRHVPREQWKGICWVYCWHVSNIVFLRYFTWTLTARLLKRIVLRLHSGTSPRCTLAFRLRQLLGRIDAVNLEASWANHLKKTLKELQIWSCCVWVLSNIDLQWPVNFSSWMDCGYATINCSLLPWDIMMSGTTSSSCRCFHELAMKLSYTNLSKRTEQHLHECALMSSMIWSSRKTNRCNPQSIS